jgi:hypothetical protein
MKYSVLTKVTNEKYKGQKFYLYTAKMESLTKEAKMESLTKEEAEKLSEILKQYPDVFSEIEIVPLDFEIRKASYEEECKSGKELTFDFYYVADDCPDIFTLLNDNFDFHFSGIDRDETVRQIFDNANYYDYIGDDNIEDPH